MARKSPLISELKARRQNLGLPVEELGERCGIGEMLLSSWENGMGSPGLDALEHWVGALGLKLAVVPAEADLRRGLSVDWANRRATVDGAPVRLTPMEWRALDRLAWTPGKLVTHEELYRHLYGAERHSRAQSTSVRVLITKLRRLLPLRIDAQWGQGYVVTGIEPSRPGACDASSAVVEKALSTAPCVCLNPEPSDEPCQERPAPVLKTAPVPVARIEKPARMEASTRLVPPPVSRFSPRRAEELGVIERFLAERGATRCPDVATIQNAPLPTLVWDKVKRKWVRPPVPGREAS